MKEVSNTSIGSWLPVLLLLVLAILVLASCTRHKLYTLEPERVPVEFIPLVEDASTRLPVSTRLSGATWENGDALGIFMLSGGGTLPSGVVDDAENCKYITLVDGKNMRFLPVKSEQTIYYPLDNTAVDFVAYYPYAETGTSAGELNNLVYPVRVHNQSVPGAIDLLYATAKNQKSTSNPVSLQLAHQLSKFRVQINHKAGADASMLKDLKIILNNMPLAAGFSLANKSLNYENESGEKEVGSILLRTVDEGAEYDAIVIPHPANRYPQRSILFSAPGAGGGVSYNYSWDISDDSFFQSGKEYTFIFMLDATGLKFAGITISDWDNVSIAPTAIEMISIPGGTFLMGSSDGSGIDPNSEEAEAGRNPDETLHSVTVSNFRISRYPITNAQYLAFLNIKQISDTGIQDGKKLFTTPHPNLKCTVIKGTSSTDTYLWSVAGGMENHPVTHVSWDGANAYTHWQGAKLPTEAQWEYACRARTTTPYHFDWMETSLDKYAWFETNNTSHPDQGIGTKAVGRKYYNPFELYDMYGNVWEWCADWYGAYSLSAVTDPVNNDNTSGKHVLRGGAFNSPATDCRSASRFHRPPESMNADQGFRIVL